MKYGALLPGDLLITTVSFEFIIGVYHSPRSGAREVYLTTFYYSFPRASTTIKTYMTYNGIETSAHVIREGETLVHGFGDSFFPSTSAGT